MGFIHHIKYEYSRTFAKNLFPYILAQAQVWPLGKLPLNQGIVPCRVSVCVCDLWL